MEAELMLSEQLVSHCPRLCVHVLIGVLMQSPYSGMNGGKVLYGSCSSFPDKSGYWGFACCCIAYAYLSTEA